MLSMQHFLIGILNSENFDGGLFPYEEYRRLYDQVTPEAFKKSEGFERCL